MGVIVAIDGPAGSGKSTAARAAAERLGFERVDTGAMYRAVTLRALEDDIEAPTELGRLTRDLQLRFRGARVLIDDRDVTRAIRSDAVTRAVSRVSAVPEVRAGLLELQRRLGREQPRGAVLEGRDIGTVVFPDAEVKIFLTASDEERARRRHAELAADGARTSYEEVLEGIRRRDRLDGTRAVAPLRAAEDAVVLDTTGKGFDEVVDELVEVIRDQLGAG
jgi:cytidylate kinase